MQWAESLNPVLHNLSWPCARRNLAVPKLFLSFPFLFYLIYLILYSDSFFHFICLSICPLFFVSPILFWFPLFLFSDYYSCIVHGKPSANPRSGTVVPGSRNADRLSFIDAATQRAYAVPLEIGRWMSVTPDSPMNEWIVRLSRRSPAGECMLKDAPLLISQWA